MQYAKRQTSNDQNMADTETQIDAQSTARHSRPSAGKTRKKEYSKPLTPFHPTHAALLCLPKTPPMSRVGPV
jgi:hypothetical protein